MANNQIFNKVPIQVPNSSGFNEDSENLFTAFCGTLVPCHIDELNPGDTVSLGVSSQVQLPPMATDFYGRVNAHFETFFVPYRLLYAGWERLITHPTVGSQYAPGTPSQVQYKYLPTLRIPASEVAATRLTDYLGFRPYVASGATTVDVLNPFRFLAYQMIYRHWYRNSRLQVDPFADSGSISIGSTNYQAATLPYRSYDGNSPTVITDTSTYPLALSLMDGHKVYSIRQRNWERDYFTNATTLPQAGDPASVAFTVNNNQGSISIASLRQANSLQRWMEKNNIAGYDYWSQIYAQFGVTPPDYALDRPVYLGRTIMNVYNHSVYVTTPQQSVGGSNNLNPFAASAGSKFASSQAVGNGSLVGKFAAREHGILMTIFSLVPCPVYDLALDRHFLANKMSDFPFPELAGVGDQEIWNCEISTAAAQGAAGGVFGYTQRYSEYKHKRDEVHGLMRSTNTLERFALKRTYSTVPSLGSSFIEIPTSALDDVTSVSGSVSAYGCWVDAFFKYSKVSKLPAYSIPTLGDPSNTHTVTITPGGPQL